MEDKAFRFTGIDIKKDGEGIEISIDNYARSPEKLDIGDRKPDEPLTREELKFYRKYKGKSNWLPSNTRPDLLLYVMNIARRQKKAGLKDLRDANRILKKIEEKDNYVTFGRVARKKDLCVIGVII